MSVIRPLQPDDADAYVVLRRTMLTEAPWAFASSPEFDRGCNADQVRESVSRPGSAILGAFDGVDLIGSAGLVRDEKPKRRHIALIWGVYVAPAARGCGLGRSVMQAALDHARTWPGLECIQLAVSERAQAARRLYESLGFTTWGIEPDALRVDGHGHAESHMRLVL